MNIPLPINDFLKEANTSPIIDVRSPSEFVQGHIPNAINVPLFDDIERARIGTAYKQIGKDTAIKIGYEIANPKIDAFLQKIKLISSSYSNSNSILVHCWRGGMRSANFADLLVKNGYKTHTLIKGYKAYRNFTLEYFNNDFNIMIVGGETGSGKTEILKHISQTGEQVIDLERIANHKGSAFGALGEIEQPTTEQFENYLCAEFLKMNSKKRIWLEDESVNIGKVHIPAALWASMKKSPILRVSIPKSLRVKRLVEDYGTFSKDELKACVLKISKRLGGQHVAHALEELEKNNLDVVADITLNYYDKAYNYNHEKRMMKDVFVIECNSADPLVNAKKIIDYADSNSTS